MSNVLHMYKATGLQLKELKSGPNILPTKPSCYTVYIFCTPFWSIMQFIGTNENKDTANYVFIQAEKWSPPAW